MGDIATLVEVMRQVLEEADGRPACLPDLLGRGFGTDHRADSEGAGPLLAQAGLVFRGGKVGMLRAHVHAFPEQAIPSADELSPREVEEGLAVGAQRDARAGREERPVL